MLSHRNLTEFPSGPSEYASIVLRPSTVRRACTLMAPTINAAGLCELASHDPGFAFHLLRIANAEQHAGTPIFRLEDAIFLLDSHSVQELLLEFGPDRSSDDVEAIGAHSRLTGLLARRIAELTSECDPSQVYVAGLLHDIGKLASLTTSTTRPHSAVGRDLAIRAGLPSFLVDAIANHHRPQAADVNPPIVRIIALADQFASALASTNRVDQTSAGDMLRSGIALFQRSDPSAFFNFNFFSPTQFIPDSVTAPSHFNRCTQ